jgi:hypothetical protein
MLLIDGDFLQYGSTKNDFIQCVERVDAVMAEIFRVADTRSYRLFLTGGKTFRHSQSPTYKANRTAEKPRYFKAIREYLVDYWNAEIVDGIEADDALGINADDDTILCSPDKDIRTISGNHLILHKTKPFELVYVSVADAWLNFYTQMLTGDGVDNVEGVKNPAKAHHSKPPNFTNDTARAVLSGKTKEEMETLVRNLYSNDEKYNLNHKLLWILREPLSQ